MGVTFDKKSAQRIAQATEYVERMVKGSGRGDRISPRQSFVGFYAKITDQQSNGKRYGFKQLKALPLSDPQVMGTGDSGELIENSYSDQEGFAFELRGSKHVLKDSIVWMMPAYGQDFYVFDYAPGVRIAKVGSSDIPARSGNNPTEATVTLYKLNSGSLQSVESLKVYNWTKSKIKRNRFINIGYSQDDKVWYIIGEDCGDSTTSSSGGSG